MNSSYQSSVYNLLITNNQINQKVAVFDLPSAFIDQTIGVLLDNPQEDTPTPSQLGEGPTAVTPVSPQPTQPQMVDLTPAPSSGIGY